MRQTISNTCTALLLVCCSDAAPVADGPAGPHSQTTAGGDTQTGRSAGAGDASVADEPTPKKSEPDVGSRGPMGGTVPDPTANAGGQQNSGQAPIPPGGAMGGTTAGGIDSVEENPWPARFDRATQAERWDVITGSVKTPLCAENPEAATPLAARILQVPEFHASYLN